MSCRLQSSRLDQSELLAEHELEDPVLSAKIARLNLSARQQLEKRLPEVIGKPASQPTARRKDPSQPLPHANPPRAEPALPNYGKGLKAVANPAAEAKEAKKRQLINVPTSYTEVMAFFWPATYIDKSGHRVEDLLLTSGGLDKTQTFCRGLL